MPLIRSDEVVEAIKPLESPTVDSYDAAVDQAYAEGIASSSDPGTEAVPKFAGYFDFSPSIKKVVREASALAAGALAPEVWKAIGGDGPAFEGTWENAGGSWQDAAVRKEGIDVVRLRGTIKSGAAGTAILTLGDGYRPAKDQKFLVSADSTTGVAVIKVTAAGEVKHVGTIVSQLQLDLSFSISA